MRGAWRRCVCDRAGAFATGEGGERGRGRRIHRQRGRGGAGEGWQPQRDGGVKGWGLGRRGICDMATAARVGKVFFLKQ